MPAPQTPREISRQTRFAGKFISLDLIHWQDATGTERAWESAERTGGPEAVTIIAHLQPSNRLVLIRQYRPPTRSLVIEFPAGIIDAPEAPAQAARREMLEETGYHGTIDHAYPPSFNSPGLTSEAVHTILMTIDEKLPANLHPVAQPDDGESIEVLLVPRNQLATFIAQQTAAGARFDSKVIAYALGQAQRYSGNQ